MSESWFASKRTAMRREGWVEGWYLGVKEPMVEVLLGGWG